LGGLLVLVAAVLPRREPAELRAVLPVFSTAAFVSMVVLAGSGTYAAWRGIGTVHAIFTTTYGLLVVGKIVLFLGLITLGNWSRLLVRNRMRPTLAYAITDATLAAAGPDSDPDDDETDEETDDDPVATERLRRSVLVETAVALLVLALTAVLVAQPRGKEALAAQYREPVSATAPLGSGRSVTITSDPGTHGTVNLTLELSPGTEPTKITATATQAAAQVGPIPVRLTRAGKGVYDGSVSLPVAGSWEIDLVVTTSQFDATSTDAILRLH
jgi:copper transport protein